MKLLLTNAGSYPRIGETPELQLLRRTQAALDRKESTPESLHAAEGALVKAALRGQEKKGRRPRPAPPGRPPPPPRPAPPRPRPPPGAGAGARSSGARRRGGHPARRARPSPSPD